MISKPGIPSSNRKQLSFGFLVLQEFSYGTSFLSTLAPILGIIDVDQFDFAVERLGAESQMAMQARVTNVRFAPESGQSAYIPLCLLCANSDLTHCSKMRCYSITSSARASTVVGMSRPSAFAVLRLITSSYFVGACTGRSPGFSPLRMRST